MVGLNDVDMEDEGEYYQASEDRSKTGRSNEAAPFWASHIVNLLSQLVKSQPTPHESKSQE